MAGSVIACPGSRIAGLGFKSCTSKPANQDNSQLRNVPVNDAVHSCPSVGSRKEALPPPQPATTRTPHHDEYSLACCACMPVQDLQMVVVQRLYQE